MSTRTNTTKRRKLDDGTSAPMSASGSQTGLGQGTGQSGGAGKDKEGGTGRGRGGGTRAKALRLRRWLRRKLSWLLGRIRWGRTMCRFVDILFALPFCMRWGCGGVEGKVRMDADCCFSFHCRV
ncbi:hypothetical protein BT69DRAFT_1128610 [Atractiella rhizophila]|nr:hypothetical protein BT69DRAFT_1128610 [Atractiella rhizophila]